MRRYRVNVRFAGWRPGDIFESSDERYALLAREGKLVTDLGPADTENGRWPR